MLLLSNDISINLADLEVRRGGAALKLEPLTLDLLVYLVRNRGRLVTKDELLVNVWKGIVVGEAAVTQAVAVLRRLLADTGRQQRMISTIRGKGYRFIGPLRQAASTALFDETTAAGTARDRATSVAPFVGRHRLMREFDAALEQAVDGSGSLVLLHGEPGSGKSRSADEFARTARGRGVRTFTAGALAVATGQAYWPWFQMFEALRASGLAAEAGAEAQLDRLRASLQPDLRDTPTRPDATSAGALDSHRLEALEQATDVVRRIASYTPILLVFDDVHDADMTSMRLLEFVARALPQMPALMVATYRNVEARTPRARADLLASLTRQPGARDEALGGLERSESGRLFEALTGRPVDTAMLDSLYRRTAGNPFFLHQLARLDVAAGEDRPAWPSDSALPAGVIDSVSRHLANLSDRCRATLTATAIFGLGARVSLLTASLDRPADEILQDIDEAVAAGVLLEDKSGYRFVHALISEALEGGLDAGERARLHLRAAKALTASGIAGDSEIAHHFHVARDVGGAARCVRYAKRAGAAAMSSLAFDEAAELYEVALDAMGHLDASDEQRLELLLGLGLARARAGELQPGQSVLRRAMEIARRCGDAEAFAWAVFGVWMRSEGDRGSPQLISDLEEAIHLYTAETPLRVRLLAQLAQALWFVPPGDRARQLALQAVELGRRLDDPEGLTLALTRAHRICQGPAAEMPQRFAFSEELHRLRPLVKDPGLRLEGRWHTAWDAIARGDRARFDLEVDALCADAQSVGRPFALWHAYVFTACRAIVDGDLQRGQADSDAALAIAPAGMEHFALHAHAVQRVALLYLRGEFKELEEHTRPRAAAGLLLGWKLEQLRAAVLQGDTEEAVRFLCESIPPTFPDGSGLQRDTSWMSCLSVLADLCVLLDLPDQARLVYRELLPLAPYQETIGPGFVARGSLERYLGCLAALLADERAAEMHFERAIATDTAFGARPVVVLDRFEFGRALLRRGGSRAARRGRSLLNEASEAAAALGMHWLTTRAQVLLERRQPRSLGDP